MRKRTKHVLIIIGVVLGLLVLSFVAYLLKFQSEINEMSPLESQEFIQDVYVIQDTFANMFLIKGGNHYIAMDAGNNADHIRQELGKLNIKEGEVVADEAP